MMHYYYNADMRRQAKTNDTTTARATAGTDMRSTSGRWGSRCRDTARCCHGTWGSSRRGSPGRYVKWVVLWEDGTCTFAVQADGGGGRAGAGDAGVSHGATGCKAGLTSDAGGGRRGGGVVHSVRALASDTGSWGSSCLVLSPQSSLGGVCLAALPLVVRVVSNDLWTRQSGFPRGRG